MDAVNRSRPILTYQIAGGQLYYAAVNERAVYLQGDPEAGFNLYGRIPGESEVSSVNLAEVLLEFAMAWNVPGDESEARRQMHLFGRHLGEALADQRARAKPVNGVLGRAADALEDVFHSLDASFAYHQTESNVPDRHIIVRINGRDARYLDGADTPLHPGDSITVASTMRLRLKT